MHGQAASAHQPELAWLLIACGGARHTLIPRFGGVIFSDVGLPGQPVHATISGQFTTMVYPEFSTLLLVHHIASDDPTWRDMLLSISCQATFGLRSHHHEVHLCKPD